MATPHDLNALQVALVDSGVCSEEEILEIIQLKKSQAEKTRRDIKKIMQNKGVSRRRAFKILSARRNKWRQK